MNGQFVKEFVSTISEKYKTGQAKEMAYRPALEKLFQDITGLNVINDPKRSEYGAPDFVFIKGKIAAAYAEAKDLGVSLDETEKGEQMARYFGYPNLILTNCLEFRFFRNGEKYETVKIAEIKNSEIASVEDSFNLLEDTLLAFIKEAKEPIKSGVVLAKVMAGQARRIRDNIKKYLKEGDEKKNESLIAVYNTIKKLLLADLDHEKFADMYAQTVVYGLFAARYHDKTADTFSRGEARDLVPKSNPFLRKFFDHIAGEDFDERVEFIVNELCEEFKHADIQAIVHDYYKVEKDDSRDPIVHFYEDFLQEYDAAERKKMGVFYTPLPVVCFIVRAIDDVLKKEFGLNGLADTSRTEIKGLQGMKAKQSVHKVQILDPATGTGTFLNEVILQIKKSFVGQEGRWSSYVRDDLLPRLHGFEIMMAPYTIAHLKLSTLLKETGVDIKDERIEIYLTNSLEKADKYDDTLFAGLGFDKAITEESRLAGKVKNDLPIMVVLGNPPYNVSSQNKGEWIGELIKDYKKDLDERNIQPLSDDYIKFIRFAQYLVDKNGEGIIGMITNNSYIDGITHRQMRKNLLETFDSIYILDLHGNAKKKETAPDGSVDQNVFSIMQGVSIALFVKKAGKKKSLGTVYHAELFGKQKDKYEALNNFDFEKMKWNKIDCKDPYYFFVPKDFRAEDEYKEGISVTNLFQKWASGVATAKDDLIIKFSVDEIKELRASFSRYSDQEIAQKYQVDQKKVVQVRKDMDNVIGEYTPILYRPFDTRYTLYSPNSEGVFQRPRPEIMKHLLKDNLAILTCKQQTSFDFQHVFLSATITDRCGVSLQTGEVGYVFPLYLYADDGSKIPNLKKEIVAEIEKIVGKVTPENVLDYIYAVLHSPSYREKYKEFLKIDFPRVPYPKNEKRFFALAKLGEELRHLHLLESSKVEKFITTYPEAGDNLVEKVVYKDGKVYINASQYFGGVPEIAWNFSIGGYQPAQKWLKDRKGRKLSNADIEHYQKIVVALVETDKLMRGIDKVNK
ncbi:MAG: type ISP restriction/modification enzyme [Patescibacteria group bacterium]